MTEGNCGNTSLATPLLNSQYESAFFLIRAHHPGLQASYYSGASWLPGLFVCSCGWGCSVGRMHWVCGHWRHGEKGRGGHSSWILALNTKVLLLFFPSSSCGFMAYLLVADFHLAMRGDLAELLQRI